MLKTNKHYTRKKRTKKRRKKIKRTGGVKKSDDSDLGLIVNALFFLDEQNLGEYVGNKYLSTALQLGKLGEKNKEERDIAYEMRKSRREREGERGNTAFSVKKTRKTNTRSNKSQTKKNRK